MRIFVCDACRKEYKPYAYTKKNGDGNCMTIVKVDRDGVMHPRARLELCPTCMDDLWDYLKIDLVREESPLRDRIFKKENENKEETVEGDTVDENPSEE